MDVTLVLHIVAGSVGLASGYTALAASKGASLHRRSGIVFVYSMLAMTMIGGGLAAFRNAAPFINIPAAVMTAYLVVTSLTTVKPLRTGQHAVDILGTAIAGIVGVICLVFGVETVITGRGRDGMPAFPFFLFGCVGVFAAVLDLRVRRMGGVRGASRLARHLWRMTFALFIAAMSFFFGQADVIPKPIRIMPLLALPVLTVLLALVYWMWKVRIRKSFRDSTHHLFAN